MSQSIPYQIVRAILLASQFIVLDCLKSCLLYNRTFCSGHNLIYIGPRDFSVDKPLENRFRAIYFILQRRPESFVGQTGFPADSDWNASQKQ